MDHLILGDNPFFGINHRSQAAGREKLKKFSNPNAVVNLFKIAEEAGAHGVMLAAHAKTAAIIQEMKKDSKLAQNFSVYPNIPYLMKYVGEVTRYGMVGAVTKMLTGQSATANFMAMLKGGLGVLKKDYLQMMETAVDIEYSMYQGVKTPAIFLHNGIVDLLLGLKMKEPFCHYADYIRKRYKAEPGFGTLNLALLADWLKKCEIEKPLIMAPFNAMGYYMNPSRVACEEAVQKGDFTLVAMNVLAQGALRPQSAFEYLGKFEKIKHVIIGASSAAHIEESFHLARKYLKIP